MKLYARLQNEKGKVDGMGGNEYLDIVITVGNEVIAKLTVRETMNGWGMFDENDNALVRFNKCAGCGANLYGIVRVHHHTEDGKDVTGI